MITLRSKIGPLEAVDFNPKAAGPVIVFFHGYGADAADLAPLAGEIALPKPVRWVFPDAPIAIPLGPYTTGRAWFNLDVERFQKAQLAGTTIDMSQMEPEGLAQARETALEFLRALGVPWDRLILGGFSQGAMLAADLSLRAEKPPRGLVVLSGSLISESIWKKLAPARKGLPFFLSHGTADSILGYSGAQQLDRVFQEAGLAGQLLTFDGGHEIPPEVMASLGEFLSRLA